jgi:hypothetical protein
MLISIVIPAFNEEKLLPALSAALYHHNLGHTGQRKKGRKQVPRFDLHTKVLYNSVDSHNKRNSRIGV